MPIYHLYERDASLIFYQRTLKLKYIFTNPIESNTFRNDFKNLHSTSLYVHTKLLKNLFLKHLNQPSLQTH